MNRMILAGILIPFAGTTLGSAMVFFMRKEMNEKVQKLLLGFASGVMIAASVWSLLIPAIEMAEQEKTIAWIPASVGFLLGMGFLLLLDTITPHLHFTEDEPEGIPSHLKKTTMLVLAVTLHNIPEGMAVGVTFAGVLTENTTMSMTGAFGDRYCNSEFSGRGNHFHATAKSGNLKNQSICIRDTFRDRGTGRSIFDDFADGAGCTASSLSAVICSRGDDLCCGRRTDSRSTVGGTLQYQYDRGGSRICPDDDPGCGTGIKIQ